MPKITFWLETNKVGSRAETVVDFDDEEWAELSEDDREKYVHDVFWEEALSRLGGWGWDSGED